jgi:hypothetical protein
VHGLRCAGNLLGWTRLLDEWIGRVLDDGTRTDAASELAEAVKRTRAFVFGGDLDAATPEIDSEGAICFELRGEPYRVRAKSITIDGALEPAIEHAFESFGGMRADHEGVSLAVVVASIGSSIDDADARDGALGSATDALAWVLTTDPSRRRILLARRVA